jgi:hypothetical protein
MLNHIRWCAASIQRVYRGWRARTMVRNAVAGGRDAAATVVQRHWRGYVVRIDPCYSPAKIRKAVKLQAWIRGCLVRRTAAQLMLGRLCATRLQAWWRGACGRRMAQERQAAQLNARWHSHLALATTAVIKIQSGWRMCCARRRVRAMLQAQADADHGVMAAVLRAAHRVEEEASALRERAAIKIQSAARGMFGKARFRMMCLLHLTAIQMQRVVRGHLARCRVDALRRDQLIVQSMATMSPAQSPVSVIAESMRVINESSTADVVPQRLNMDDTVEVAPVPTAVVAEEVSAVAEVAVPAVVEEIDVTEVAEEAAPTAEVVPVSATVILTPAPVAAATAPADEPRSEPSVSEMSVSRANNLSTIVGEVATDAVDEALRHMAACTITHFFATVASRREVQKRRRQQRPSKRQDLAARQHEMETACCSLQRSWRGNRASVAALHQRTIRRHAHSVAIARQGKPADQERATAAHIIQRSLPPRLSRRQHADCRAAAAAVNGTAALEQERVVAVHVMQRFGRVAAAKGVRRARMAASPAPNSRQQERDVATAIIVAFARSAHARHVALRRRETQVSRHVGHSAAAEWQERDVAAAQIQHVARRRTSSQRQSPVACVESTEAAEQEQLAAVLVLQRFARNIQVCNRADAARRSKGDATVGLIAGLFASAGKLAGRKGLGPISDVLDDLEEEATEGAGVVVQSPTRDMMRRPFVRAGLHVGFSEAAAMHESHILPEPELEAATDPEHQHDESHRGAYAESAADVAAAHKVEEERADDRHVHVATPEAAAESPKTPTAEQVEQEQLAAVLILQRFARNIRVCNRADAARQSQGDATVRLIAGLFASAGKLAGRRGLAPVADIVDDMEENVTESNATHHVGFSEVAQMHDSHILSEPELEAATDPEHQHDESHRASHAESAADVAAAHKVEEERADDRHVHVVTPDVTAAPQKAAALVIAAKLHSWGSTGRRRSVAMKDMLDEFAEEPTEAPVEATPFEASAPQEEDAATLNESASIAVTAPSRDRMRRSFSLCGVTMTGPTEEAVSDDDVVEATAPVVAAEDTYESRQELAARRSTAALRIQSSERQRASRSKAAVLRQAKRERQWLVQERESTAAAVADADRDAAVQYKSETAHRAMRDRAALRIQCSFRCHNARFMRAWMVERRRAKHAEATMREWQALREASAVRLQCAWRQGVARTVTKDKRRVRSAARRDFTQRDSTETAAAVRMQCAYRVYNAKFEVAWRREDRDKSDAAAAAERADEEAAKREASESAGHALVERERAALCVQCAYRSHNARFDLRQRHEATLAAASQHSVTLQAAGRASSTRKQLGVTWNAGNSRMPEKLVNDAITAALSGTADPADDDTL